MNEHVINEVIQAAGGASALARELGLNRPAAVTNWRARGQIPAQHCIKIERLTGISRHTIRPDVFGARPECAA